MGFGESKSSAGPKLFYLVFGAPPIICRRGVDNGPLIFNVEPMERKMEPPQSAETRKCPLFCRAKQAFKLVKTSRDPQRGWRLQFSIDSAAAPFNLKIYAGASLNYEDSSGFGLIKSDPNQSQFCVYEKRIEAGNNILFNDPHTPIFLHTLNPENSGGGHDEVFSRLRESPLAIEMSCDGVREGSESQRQTRLFLFLTFYKSDLEPQELDDSRDSIPAACIKEYLLSAGELFELDDIFDMMGDEAPTESKIQQAEEVIAVDDVSCVICLTNQRNTTIIPCRHMCVCAECASLLQQQSGKCPMCRREIVKLLTLCPTPPPPLSPCN